MLCVWFTFIWRVELSPGLWLGGNPLKKFQLLRMDRAPSIVIIRSYIYSRKPVGLSWLTKLIIPRKLLIPSFWLQCSECPRHYSLAEELRDHYLKDHGTARDEKVSCPTCGKSFTRKWDMKRHHRIYHEAENDTQVLHFYHIMYSLLSSRSQLGTSYVANFYR